MPVIFLALCLIFSSFRSFAVDQQDIVIKSRFDLESSEVFINQLRIFLGNSQFGDPYAQKLKDNVVIDLAKLIEEVPQDTQNWINELQSVLRLRFFDSSYKIVIDKLSYSIQDFNAELIPGTSTSQRVEFVTNSYVKGIHLKAESVSFEVELQKTLNKKPIKFKIQLISPEFVLDPELITELSMGWVSAFTPNNIELILNSIDISKLFEQVVKNPSLVELTFKELLMPEVSILIGNKEVYFDQAKIRSFLYGRKEEMKKAILDLLSAKMQEKFKNIIKDNSKKILLPKRYNIDAVVKGFFNLNDISLNKTGISQFDLSGFFCDDSNSLINEFICEKKIYAKTRRSVDLSQYQRSLRLINRKLVEKKSNIALSISEHYLNNIVEATIKAGLWEKNFAGKDFRLGPENSFILAEEMGNEFSLYLDIIYKLKGSQRILVGRSEFRFPVKFMIALNLEDVGGIPHFMIKVKKIAVNNDLLLNGAPEYNLPSTVNSVPRFRNKVLQGIMEEVRTFDQRVLIDLELPMLKGTYLNQLDFSSDGLGRATATLGFK